MSLPGFSIKRPVTVSMFFLAVSLFGFISLSHLRQELFPTITYPKLSVVTSYLNAAPEEIETLITKPIEEAVGSISGLRDVSSSSKEGLSVVVAEFGWEQDMDFAALSVREKIDLIKARLPRDAEEPTVIKYNPFERPVMTLSISSTKRSGVLLKRFAEKWFKDEVEKLDGVASATLSGGRDEEIKVEVDQGRLMAAGIAINDVSNAISQANLNYPGGTIKESFYEYLVRTIGEFENISEVEKISVGREELSQEDRMQGREDEPDHRLILLEDVATVKRSVKKRTSYSRFNGLENVTLTVQKQAKANVIHVANGIHDKLKELEPQIPEDIKFHVVDDQSKFIRETIGGVRDTAIQGGILAFLILLIFLKSVRTSILVVVIAPITVLATFSLMHFMGISLNVISLGGIALGVGMLVDSAIVVIENSFRVFQERPGSALKENACLAAEEVVAPLTASILTTVMVFLPMIFVTGIAGQFFKELAWVIVVMQLISLVVAFTLIPMLIAQLGSTKPDTSIPGKFLGVLSAPIAYLGKVYEKILPHFVRKRGRYLFLIVLAFLFSLWVMSGFDKILMPRVDQGKFLVNVSLPVGTRVEVTNQVASVLESLFKELPELENITVMVGSSRGTSSEEFVERLASHESEIIVNLKEQQKRPTRDIVQEYQKKFSEPEVRKILKGADINFVLFESAFQVGDEDASPVVIHVKGNSLRVIRKLTSEIREGLSKIEGTFDVVDTYPESSPETKVIVNKDRASFYRLSVTDLATAAHISIKGIVASKFKEGGKEIDIQVQLREEDRDQISKLDTLLMHSPLGFNVPLGELVKFQVGHGPSEIKRMDQQRTVRVMAKVYGRSMSEVNESVENVLRQIKIPDGYYVETAGESLEVKESFASLQFALILAILLVYMVMAAQFESLLQPFIIMFTVPLSIIGVALALYLSGTALNVVVILGIILLGGIVVNNGIILIDVVNQRMSKGSNVMDAIQTAGKIRFRPILMTAFTTIFGMAPLALMPSSEGAKLLSPLAITVMGGLFVATFLTLVVVPAIFAVSEGFRGNKGSKQP